ncbi:MAG: hypothetical protein ACI4WG_06605 [Erysipelotrichaceae bacterium]
MEKLISKVNKKWLLYSSIIAIIMVIINLLNYFLYFLPATNGNRYLELTLYYTVNDIYTLAENYGVSGRNAYIMSSAIIDTLIPLTLTAFLIFLTLFLEKKTSGNKSKKIISIGITACLSDWMENIFLMTTLKLYPIQYPILVIIAGIMTTIKYLLLIYIIIMIISRGYKLKKG